MIAFTVHDMSCSHCVKAITQAVHAVDGNARVDIDLAAHRVQVNATLAEDHVDAFAKAIREAGYTPVPA